MEENIITWNFANWITIVLMAALGFVISATVIQIGQKLAGASSSD